MAHRRIVIDAEKAPKSAPWTLNAALLIGGAFFLGFIVLGIGGIQVWEYTNSVPFCTDTCHDVHPEEPVAYQDSYHAQVKCTECHMGRLSTMRAMVLKTSHARHLPEVLFHLYERPLEAKSMRPANESCERCHSALASHDNMARKITHFRPDENNTELHTYLLLKTGRGIQDPDQGPGIHWHVANKLEYIATDDHKQEIRWVRASQPDGQYVEYNDLLNPLSPEEIADTEKRVMDCVDCHNRIGHPFRSPEKLIDQALAEGRLSTGLPFVKKELLSLLTPDYASQADALAAAGSWLERYQEVYPDLVVSHQVELQQASEVARELVARLFFEEPGVSWQSFSDNVGHKNSPGCFRCHDGMHVSSEGRSIRLQCNLCHSIPVTVDAGAEPPAMPFVSVEEPASHQDSNFVRDHRLQAKDSCVDCHGELNFGRDDSSFCANSACHGQKWTFVNLDASSSHPFGLEGQHAIVSCFDCHDGVQDIAYECANCHEPPSEPHYGPECQDCHTPNGFDQVLDSGLDHPMPLEGRHGTLGCGACHEDSAGPDPNCSTCHEPPQDHLTEGCETCHAPSGWVESARSAMVGSPTIPHQVSAGEDCMACHDAGGQGWPVPEGHASYNDTQCVFCHAAGEQILVVYEPNRIRHQLDGLHVQVACASCHSDGAFQATQQDCAACHVINDQHSEQPGQDCAQCHSTAGWSQAVVDHSGTLFPLTGRHVAAACELCHPGGQYAGTPQACVACHAGNDRHNGQFGQECAQCHSPDGWAGAALDHARTPFPLTGRHVVAACELCHAGGQYAGTPQACVACHADNDRHNGQFGQECAQCHSPDGWSGATFDHARTPFPLTGRHVVAACELCHAGGQYAGTPQACVACHAGNDRHNGQFGQECAQCHSPDGWAGAALDHARTPFPLTGRHVAAACELCHAGGQYAGTPQTCVACHAGNDRHNGQFGQECAQCHSPDGWAGATFDHARTPFPLTGRHTAAACAQCHAGGQYAGTPQACVACHAGNDRHSGQFGQECAQCHSPDGWAGATFDHARTPFPLTGRHIAAACAQCHAGGQYAGTPQACAACHAGNDRHSGQFGQECAQCHSPDGWAGANFDHARTPFPLTGRHIAAACAQCHAGGQYAGTPQACVACHAGNDRHNGQFGQECAECHSPDGWAGATFDHARTPFPLTGRHVAAACEQCHAGGQYAGTPQACVACHAGNDRHNGQFGQDCVQCHSPDGWTPARYDGPHTFPFDHGGSGSTPCQTCHPNTLSSYTCYGCHEHEPAKVEDDHSEEEIADLNNCVACHPTGKEH